VSMRPTPPLVEKEGGTEPGPFLLGFADLLRAWDRIRGCLHARRYRRTLVAQEGAIVNAKERLHTAVFRSSSDNGRHSVTSEAENDAMEFVHRERERSASPGTTVGNDASRMRSVFAVAHASRPAPVGARVTLLRHLRGKYARAHWDPTAKPCHFRLMATRLVLDLASARRQLVQEKMNIKQVVLRQWVSSHEVSRCPVCVRLFSIFIWRYNCRVCGGVYCGSCTLHRLRTTVHPQPVRCCTACYSHTLRAQKLRQLQRAQHSQDIIHMESPPVPVTCEVPRPRVCYSSSCRSGDTRNVCFSPHCQFDAETEPPALARQTAFTTLALAVKERHQGPAPNFTASDLWELCQLHRVPTEEWLAFLLEVFKNGEPVLVLDFAPAVLQVVARMDDCATEAELAALGARIKGLVEMGVSERARIYLRFTYRERLGSLRLLRVAPPLQIVAPVLSPTSNADSESPTGSPSRDGQMEGGGYYEGCEGYTTDEDDDFDFSGMTVGAYGSPSSSPDVDESMP
jgi:hypothetical protein